MKKWKKILFCAGAVLLAAGLLLAGWHIWVQNRLTYLESTSLSDRTGFARMKAENETNHTPTEAAAPAAGTPADPVADEAAQAEIELERSIEVRSERMTLTQSFRMPYSLLKGVNFTLDANGRDNNSIWRAEITDASGKCVFSETFNASSIEFGDCSVEAKSAVPVKKGETYTLSLRAERVKPYSGIGFYVSDYKTEWAAGQLLVNGKKAGAVLDMALLGCDADPWWLGAYLCLAALLLAVAGRAVWVKRRGRALLADPVLRAAALAAVLFLMLAPFARGETKFLDECDNVRGGMMIARGAVLYRDYITQHTPLLYYLCALFALTGAGSLEQFRLMFALFCALFWALAYLRYAPSFGQRKMFWLPVCIQASALVAFGHASQPLAEYVQGMCLVGMLLEYMRYRREKTLSWGRCAVLSLTFWGAAMAAFLSLYSLACLGVAFLAGEVLYWRGAAEVKPQAFAVRYVPLLICGLMPPACMVAYFMASGAAESALEQAYRFNREVYPDYISGLGKFILQPFYEGISQFCTSLANTVLAFGSPEYAIADVCLFAVGAALIAALVLWAKHKPALAAFLFVLTCTGAARGVVSFHGYAFWAMAITVVFLFASRQQIAFPRRALVPAVLLLCLVTQPYVQAVSDSLSAEPAAVSVRESNAASLTAAGSTVFVDANTEEAIYLLYRGNMPATRLSYLLPWYMDWYEEDTIADLQESKPDVVIWNEDQVAWDRQHFCPGLQNYIRRNYVPSAYDSALWIRKARVQPDKTGGKI